MKNLIMKKDLLVLAFTAVLLMIASLWYGCKKPSTENVNLVVNTSVLFKSPVLVHFSNANTASSVKPADFDVAITGKDSMLVQMDGGSTSFKAMNGFLPLSLSSRAAPSEANPVLFNVYAQIPGFAPISQTIRITSDTMKVYDISAIEYANPASGTATLVNVLPLTGGISNGATFSTPTRAAMPQAATITVPAGTQMLDERGAPITASQVNAYTTNYSAVSPTSYGAFPGGYNPTNVVDQTGAPINGGNGINFVSAGLLSVKMLAGNSEVKKFSKPIQISMEMNSNTTNFLTGTDIKAGDVVPLWSLNEKTGQWKKESDVTLTSNGGKVVANFQTTHLSCFNLDWSWAVAGASYGTCNKSLSVTLHVGAGKSGSFDVALVTPNNQYLAAAHGEYIKDGGKVVFPNVPSIAQAKVVVSAFNLYLNPSLPILAQSVLFNPCSQGSVDLTYGAPPSPDYIDVNISLSGKCTSSSLNVSLTGWVYLYDQTLALAGNLDAYSAVYMKNGAIAYAYGIPFSGSNGTYKIQLVNGHKYSIQTYNSKSYYDTGLFTLVKSGFELPSASGISGSAVYNTAKASLDINGVFSVNCN